MKDEKFFLTVLLKQNGECDGYMGADDPIRCEDVLTLDCQSCTPEIAYHRALNKYLEKYGEDSLMELLL
jgi:hypothetical protein